MKKKIIFCFSLIMVFCVVGNARAQEGEKETEALTIVIEAKNSNNAAVKIPIKYYLPYELTRQHIEDAGGFEVREDEAKDQLYLFKEEAFEPNQTKQFYVKVANIWFISESLVNKYVRRSEKMLRYITDPSDKESGEVIFLAIKDNAKKIIDSQRKAGSVKEHIATFRENRQRLDDIETDIAKLRQYSKNLVFDDKEKADKKTTWHIIVSVAVVMIGAGVLFIKSVKSAN